MDLVTFLAARLDEDEAVALAAMMRNAMDWHQGAGSVGQCTVLAAGRTVVSDHAPAPEETAHIARHDPARALREVEAGRKLLAEYREAVDGPDQDFGVADALERVMQAKAAVYSDHPDYRADLA